MDKKQIAESLKTLRESNKRNFTQTVDLIFSYKNLDIKKPDNQLDFSVVLHKDKGKKAKTCALVGPELQETAKENCDTVILVDDFEKYAKDKKTLKKIASDHDFFIAQGNLMAKVATSFGRVLGPKGKMPNPKAGCVVPPNANLKALVGNLHRTVRVVAKTALNSQVVVGKEDMSDEDIIDNIITVEDAVVHHLPGGKAQLKSLHLKLTMSKPVKLE